MPRTETVERTIFKFDELDPSVQERVIERWREGDYFFWGEERKGSLEAFEKCFPIEVHDWEVCPFSQTSGMRWSLTCGDDVEALSGLRLWKWLWNNDYGTLGLRGIPESKRKLKFSAPLGKAYMPTTRILRLSEWEECPLTGYCGDHDILEPIAKFMLRPDSYTKIWRHVTLHDLMMDCLESWSSGFESDIEHWHSEEFIREDIEASEHEFLEDGSTA